LQGADQGRRVLIVERDDGTYAPIDQKKSPEYFQRAANRQEMGIPAGQDLEIAEREATPQFHWFS
jgi:hypothetical protein